MWAVAAVLALCVEAANAAVFLPITYRAAAAGRPLWIFLHDKGPSSTLKRRAIGDGISPRAAARIARRGGVYDPASDRPVFAPYRDSLIAAGVKIQAESRWFDAVAGWIDSAGVDRVASLAFVDSLRPVALFTRPREDDVGTAPGLVKPTVPPPGASDYGTSLSQLVAIQVDSLHKLGLDGQGVRIGFLDTGFSLDIDAFSSLDLIGMRDFIHGDDDVGDGDTVAMRHGTGTLSVCGGWAPGELIGVAYGAEYVVAKTELINEEIQIEESYWVAGLEWLDSMGCDLASSSLAYTNWYTDADYNGMTAISTLAADHAAARGLLVVNAVGNQGCDGEQIHIMVPADGDSVLAVGAADHDGEKVSFSSCGPTFDGRIKPDVMAPGIRVWSADPRNGQYGYSSGTSLATPLVAGVCALLLQMDPSLAPLELIELLRSTATKARKPMNTYGWGMVQAVRAASMLDTTPEPDHQDVTVWPNPADSQVTIALPEQDSAMSWRVEVYTAAGQPVDKWEVVGYDRTSWPGTNSDGRPVAAGVYLLRVKTPMRERIIKVAWMPRR